MTKQKKSTRHSVTSTARKSAPGSAPKTSSLPPNSAPKTGGNGSGNRAMVRAGSYNPDAWNQAVNNVLQGDTLPQALIKVGFAPSFAYTRAVGKLRELVRLRVEELTKDYLDRCKANLAPISEAETKFVKNLAEGDNWKNLPKAAANLKQIKQAAGVLGSDTPDQAVVKIAQLNVIQAHIGGRLEDRETQVIDVETT